LNQNREKQEATQGMKSNGSKLINKSKLKYPN